MLLLLLLLLLAKVFEVNDSKGNEENLEVSLKNYSLGSVGLVE